MTLSTRTINIDNLPSYCGKIEGILEDAGLLASVKYECRESEEGFRNFWSYLDSREGSSLVARKALEVLSQEIPKHISHITAFHGCRVDAPENYRKHGLKACDPQQIVKDAITRFGDEDQVREIARELRKNGYIQHNGGKIYAVKSMKHHMENGGLCHATGSELLGLIAKRLTPSREEELYSNGEPSVIEFLVPLEWMVEAGSDLSYTASLLSCVASNYSPYHIPNDARSGGVVLKRSIPPELLVRRFICDVDGYAERVAETYNED